MSLNKSQLLSIPEKAPKSPTKPKPGPEVVIDMGKSSLFNSDLNLLSTSTKNEVARGKTPLAGKIRITLP